MFSAIKKSIRITYCVGCFRQKVTIIN